MTFYPVLADDARKAYEDSIGVCWAEAQRQLSLNEEALVLRDLLASQDLKLATESWVLPAITATGYTTWINCTIDDTRFTAVYGFGTAAYGQVIAGTAGSLLGAPSLAALTLMRITRGGKQLRIWQIEPYTKNGVAVGSANGTLGAFAASPQLFTYYSDDPVTVFQDIPFVVEVFSTVSTFPIGTTSATPVLPLLGKVAEPEGKTINR